ncbi:hypothetical protein IAR50_003704 [Cryptococcus sp. DSM 104548]
MEATYTSVELSRDMAGKLLELLTSGGDQKTEIGSSHDPSLSPSLDALQKYTKSLTLAEPRALQSLGKITQPRNICPNLERFHLVSGIFADNPLEPLDATTTRDRLKDLLRIFTRLLPTLPHIMISFSPAEFLVSLDEPEIGLPSIITLRQQSVVPVLLPVDTLTLQLPSAAYTEDEWVQFSDSVKLYELPLCWVPRKTLRVVFEFNQALTGAKLMSKVFSRLILVAGEIYGSAPYPNVTLEIVIPYKAGFTETIAKTLTIRLFEIMGATLAACRTHEVDGEGKGNGDRGAEEWEKIMAYWDGGNVSIKGMSEADIANP